MTCKNKGWFRSIGVSNFLPHHLHVLEETGVAPVLDQLECHPGYLQRSAVAYCKQNGILVQAWSPLGRARVLQDPLLREIAEAHHTSTARICLAYLLQNGMMVLPKASSKERLEENLCRDDIILSEQELKRIEAMPVTGWSGENPDTSIPT